MTLPQHQALHKICVLEHRTDTSRNAESAYAKLLGMRHQCKLFLSTTDRVCDGSTDDRLVSVVRRKNPAHVLKLLWRILHCPQRRVHQRQV